MTEFNDHQPDDSGDTKLPVAPPGHRLVNPFDLYLEREGAGGQFWAGDYVAFNGQTGKWTRRKEPIGATEPFLCCLQGIAIGWVKYVDGKIVNRVSGFIRDGYERPDRSTLDDRNERNWPNNRRGDKEDPWRQTTYLVMRSLQDDTEVMFAPFAPTQLRAVADLVAGWRRTQHDGREPVVNLGSRSFDNQSGGTTFVPVFKQIDLQFWAGDSAPELQPIAVPIEKPKPVDKPPDKPALTDQRQELDEDIPF